MGVEVSVVLPCRDEEKTVGKCIADIKKVFLDHKIDGEVVVSDSSTDNSAAIAKRHGATLIKHSEKGYGIAIQKGIEKSKGRYIIIGDADGTYDFKEIPKLLAKTRKGFDLVIGSRLRGDIQKGAMPFSHRYIGNPFLSSVLNLFFHTKLSDTHSGFRCIRRSALIKLDLKTKGMEYASEMIIKAAKQKLRISEVPIRYSVRIGKSKLESISDGWRHLRFMLMFSPTYLFIFPGLFLMAGGLFSMNLGMIASKTIFPTYLSLFSLASTIIGFQIICLGLFSKIYAIHTGFEKSDAFIDYLARKIPLERGILIGILIILAGIIGLSVTIKGVMLAPRTLFITMMILGIQFIFSVFFISIMLVEKQR